MSDLMEIAERCEKATGPCREIDCEVAIALFGGEIIWKQSVGTMEAYPVRRYVSRDHVGGFCNGSVPAYTASLDAITALIAEKLPGWRISDLTQDSLGWFANLTTWNEPWRDEPAQSETPALVLCTVFLRALAQDASDGR